MAVARRPSPQGGIEPAAIIAASQLELPSLIIEFHQDLRGSGMPEGVCDCLARNAEDFVDNEGSESVSSSLAFHHEFDGAGTIEPDSDSFDRGLELGISEIFRSQPRDPIASFDNDPVRHVQSLFERLLGFMVRRNLLGRNVKAEEQTLNAL
jgi:hypothetical protein